MGMLYNGFQELNDGLINGWAPHGMSAPCTGGYNQRIDVFGKGATCQANNTWTGEGCTMAYHVTLGEQQTSVPWQLCIVARSRQHSMFVITHGQDG